MYRALYRKWRPQRFEDVVGQRGIVTALRNQIATGRVGHAYLFTGVRGTGKTTCAKIFAKAVNCLHPQNGDPCGECEICKGIDNGSILDVVEMDAASNNGVDDIRDLRDETAYTPSACKYKVYIIDEVHMLSTAAFNALLKTLEEPPSYMVFILATTEPQKIPATILSRCQRFDFGRLTEEQMTARILAALPELKDAEPAALSLIARAADGSMRDAWSLLDMCIGSGERLTEHLVRQALGASDSEFLFDFASAIAASDGTRVLNMIDDMMRAGRDVQVFLRDFAAHVRQVAAFKLGARPAADMTGEGAQRYRAQSEEISMPRLLRMLELAMQAEADTRYASSPRGVLELFALRACRVAEGEDVQALTDRLEDMEHQLQLLQKNGVRLAAPADAPANAAPQAEKKPAARPAPAPMPGAEATLPEGKKPSDVWNAALKRLAREAVACFAIINQGRFGGYAEGTYKLIFPRNAAISVDFVNAEERKAQIEKILTEEGGAPAKFEARMEEAVARSAAGTERDEQLLIDTLGRDKVQIDND